MSILWHKWVPHKQGLATVKDDGPAYSLCYLVRTSTQNEKLADIRDAPGINIGDTFQDAAADWVVCKSSNVKAADDSGLLWEVTFVFEPLRPDEGNDPGGGEGGGGGVTLPPIPVWSATGSSSVVPVYKDANGDMITNSAGDPLEGLEKEKSEFTLILTKPYLNHGLWLTAARAYTDTCNSAAWNGGAQHTWLCRFRSASVERKDGLIYWSTQWEFAYREETWKLMPWDIGFHELDGDGSGGYQKKVITGTDGKGVRQPVALAGGTPLPEGEPPVVIRDGEGAKVYKEANFNVEFGQVFTPIF